MIVFLVEFVGVDALGEWKCQECFVRFKKDGFRSVDEEYSGRSKRFKYEELDNNYCQTQEELAESVRVTSKAKKLGAIWI